MAESARGTDRAAAGTDRAAPAADRAAAGAGADGAAVGATEADAGATAAGVRETVAVALLTFLVMTLPLRGATASNKLAGLMLVATIVGTVVARRRVACGGRVERVLRRATLAALVASVLLLVLVAATA